MGAVTRHKGAIAGTALGIAGGPLGMAAGGYLGDKYVDKPNGSSGQGNGIGILGNTAATGRQIGIGGNAGTVAGATPPPAPDLADQMIRAAQRAEAARIRVGTTRASQFKPKPGGGY